jgi:hypothetical protein
LLCAAAVFGVAAVEVALGGIVLYGWDISVAAQVTTDDAGLAEHLTVSFGPDDVGPVGPVQDLVVSGQHVTFKVNMKLCRSEGGITSWFKRAARPEPGMYSFGFSAPGFAPVQVEGHTGVLTRVDSGEAGTTWSLTLPSVQMKRDESAGLSNYRLNPTVGPVTRLAKDARRAPVPPAG